MKQLIILLGLILCTSCDYTHTAKELDNNTIIKIHASDDYSKGDTVLVYYNIQHDLWEPGLELGGGSRKAIIVK